MSKTEPQGVYCYAAVGRFPLVKSPKRPLLLSLLHPSLPNRHSANQSSLAPSFLEPTILEHPRPMDDQERVTYSGYLPLQTHVHVCACMRIHTHTPHTKQQNAEIRDFLKQTPDQILNNSLI